ncbi:MAG: adenine deaminase [Parafilimonas sp.]|nr:adenine deaminase [Parafilimonas sp.]
MRNKLSIPANYVSIKNKTINTAELLIQNGKIFSIKIISQNETSSLPYILPGFIDSHVHIESSMVVPSEFARLAVVHGTVATVSDPHEIANVCGIKGVEFMIENSKRVNFKFYFGAPSCVPATNFETTGATLNAENVLHLLQKPEIHYLSEMMNFPGVLKKDEEVMKKIEAAKKLNKPVDGHAPGLRGEEAKKYIEAGILTDHECFTKEEALDKLRYEMKIIIREGSAAKNFEALVDLLNDYPDKIMFCSDDKHPDSLVEGHINKLCERAVAKGIDVFKVLQAACINPVHHYKLNVGLLNEGDAADFVLVNDLKEFKVYQTFINGKLVAENGKSLIKSVHIEPINNFSAKEISENNLKVFTNSVTLINNKLPVIEALDGQLITNKMYVHPLIRKKEIISDIENDILKIVVVNRYKTAPVAKAFIKNLGFKKGAIASSVAHDSHNIVAAGCDDKSIAKAINLIIQYKGGISCVDEKSEKIVTLPVAGLMSDEDGYKIANAYSEIDKMAKSFGSRLSAPFMTLSFMALLVIPHIKLSDKGLFDGDSFLFI